MLSLMAMAVSVFVVLQWMPAPVFTVTVVNLKNQISGRKQNVRRIRQEKNVVVVVVDERSSSDWCICYAVVLRVPDRYRLLPDACCFFRCTAGCW
jgi:flavin reductase (DIM6/NTAB) family NADH-FMN oxidoreductase RutF